MFAQASSAFRRVPSSPGVRVEGAPHPSPARRIQLCEADSSMERSQASMDANGSFLSLNATVVNPAHQRLLAGIASPAAPSPLHPRHLFNPQAGTAAASSRAGPPPEHGEASSIISADMIVDGQTERDHAMSPSAADTIPRPTYSQYSDDRRSSSGSMSGRRLVPPKSPVRSPRASPSRARVNEYTASPHHKPVICQPATANQTAMSMDISINHFDTCEPIGMGSFGKVYKCRRKIDLTEYAVKVIEMRSELERDRLLKEVYALASQGDNPHVVRYYSAWQDERNIFIQMELCGQTLAQKRKQLERPLDLGELFDVLVQIASGLAFMHRRDIAHLDVKPENIYTTVQGIYKLGDLGFASVINPRAAEEAGEGDKRYLSRERLQSESCDLKKADIFSLGISIWELASEQPLPSEGDAYHALRDGSAPMPAALPIDAQDLVRSMLDSDPDKRPAARDILQHGLFAGRLREEALVALRLTPQGPGRGRREAAAEDLDFDSAFNYHKKALKMELSTRVERESMKKEREKYEQEIGALKEEIERLKKQQRFKPWAQPETPPVEQGGPSTVGLQSDTGAAEGGNNIFGRLTTNYICSKIDSSLHNGSKTLGEILMQISSEVPAGKPSSSMQ